MMNCETEHFRHLKQNRCNESRIYGIGPKQFILYNRFQTSKFSKNFEKSIFFQSSYEQIHFRTLIFCLKYLVLKFS